MTPSTRRKWIRKKTLIGLADTTRTEQQCKEAIEIFIPVLEEYEKEFEQADISSADTSELVAKVKVEMETGRLSTIAAELDFARTRVGKWLAAYQA